MIYSEQVAGYFQRRVLFCRDDAVQSLVYMDVMIYIAAKEKEKSRAAPRAIKEK